MCAALVAIAAVAAAARSRSIPPGLAPTALASVLAGGAILAFRFIPAFDPLGRVRWRLPSGSQQKRCAITFDDGPSAATARVLDILAAERVPATFSFSVGMPIVTRRWSSAHWRRGTRWASTG